MQLESIQGKSISINHAVVPEEGEDCFAVQVDAMGGILCVADGCGGSGAGRYHQLENRSQAYWAARLSVDWACDWAAALDGGRLPQNAAEAKLRADEFAAFLHRSLSAFHQTYQNASESHVCGSMRRTLPTTLCMALIDARQASCMDCVFFWAGDSRAFLLTPRGLRQCTRDQLCGRADAFENLYRDSPLSNMVNADHPFTLNSYGLRVDKPCVVITATDGAFAYLPTPMEFELLLLSTMQQAHDLESWRARLSRTLAKTASDDSTLVLSCFGFEDFETMRAAFEPRKLALQRDFVTPVRRRRQSVEYARTLWAQYRREYEEDCDADWQL